jgi:hypothetical protein
MKSTMLGVLSAALLVCSGSANAFVITIAGSGVSGVDGKYEVSLVEGTGADLLGVLDDQVWFGNVPLTRLFSETLGTGLGMPNAGGLRGPHFLAVTDGSIFANNPPFQGYRYCLDSCAPGQVTPIAFGFTVDSSFAATWATARRVQETVPEPGTLLLLGLGFLGLLMVSRRATV